MAGGKIPHYYMEESVLLGTKPHVDSIRHFIQHSGQTSAHVRALEWRKGGQNGGATSWVQVETLKSPHWS